MMALTIGIRVMHLWSLTLLVGVFGFLLLIARPAYEKGNPGDWPGFARFDHLLLRLSGWCLLVAVCMSFLGLWVQLASVTGLALSDALTLEGFGGILTATRYGHVWLMSLALMAFLGVVLRFCKRERDARDWWTVHLIGAGLAACLLVARAWTGHAAAAEGAALLLQVAVDALHLLAAGLWLGGLPLLALLLARTRRADNLSTHTMAALAVRRFSALGFGSVLLLIVTGLYNAWVLVGSVPALLATPYGQLLLLKVALFLPLLGLAGMNRLREVPHLLRLAAEPAWPKTLDILARLRRNILTELTLGCGIFVLVGALGVTPPARHVEPAWPFSFRLSWQATRDLPGVSFRLFVGSSAVVVGLLALGSARWARRYWAPALGVGFAGVGWGLWSVGSATAIDAYPTTYLRPSVPYQALAIANGLRLYQQHCAFCHGVAGDGEGPAAAVLRPRPADLTARHTADHTAGDMFWWVSYGKKGTAMPGFQDRLSPEERWDLINCVRTLAAAEQARPLGPLVAQDPWLVAPDFVFTTEVSEGGTLKDHRGQNIVLLVLFRLPDSQSRLVQLDGLHARLRDMRVEVLGIPLHTGRENDRRLSQMSVRFPFVHDGAAEVATTYTLFRRRFSPEGIRPDPPIPSHLEFLIDRQGYIRARWIAVDDTGWLDTEQLIAAIEQLNREKPRAAAPDDHVH